MPPVLLAADRVPAFPLTHLLVDAPARGAVARAYGDAVVRAEPGPAGPLIFSARASATLEIDVWGPRATPADVVDEVLEAARGWVGLHDDPRQLDAVVRGHRALWALRTRLGAVRLSRIPRVGEAFGRAVLGQLVQRVEARRSARQFAAAVGTRASEQLWCWPTGEQVAATPAWTMRRCGVSLRGARALHAGALDRALDASRGEWALLDARLRALPGVGVWTSGETRLALGDPDAVPVGDYHLPTLVGHLLGGGRRVDGPPWTDAEMLELLAPFSGQRGRVLRLLKRAVRAGVVEGPTRRAPRAPVSAHRYW